MTLRRPASPPPALPLENDDLLREILLRLPPQPSSLPRASVVCKGWRCIVTDPQFLRRFRDHHRDPPLLGFFIEYRGSPVFRSNLNPPDLIPPERFLLDRRDEGDTNWEMFGCRHGRVLVFDQMWYEFIVWEPDTGDRVCVPVPQEFDDEFKFVVSGTVLCAASDEGHVHGDCHSSPFHVVLLALHIDHGRAAASVYSSETGIWSNLISTAGCTLYDMSSFSTLVGHSLYWLFDDFEDGILEFDLDRQSLANIEMPPGLKHSVDYCFQIMPAEGGGVGLAIFTYSEFEMWQRKVSRDGVTRWALQKRVKLDNCLGLGPMSGEGLLVLGYDESVHVIYIWTCIGVCIVQLESVQFTYLGKTNSITTGCHPIHPYRSFYIAACKSSRTAPSLGEDVEMLPSSVITLTSR